MLVVNRFRTADHPGPLRADLESVHTLLAQQPGYVTGWLGRNLDDPDLWVLTTRWANVGAYRRALSSYDVKLHGVPVLSRAIDEPSAFEVVEPDTGTVALLAANGFFVASEFALVGARRTRIEALADAGNARAKLARGAIQHLDHYISGTQLGITLASLALGWVGESTIAAIITQLFIGLGSPWDVLAGHTIADGRASGVRPYADGSVLDDRFGSMGGWVASTLVRLGDLKKQLMCPEGAIAPLPRPLVFLNACTSTAMRPADRGSFTSFLLRQRFLGVIGTLCDISDTVAAHFATIFYQAVLSGSTAGEAMREARWHLMDRHHNPLGLLYTFHGDPDIKLAHAHRGRVVPACRPSALAGGPP